MACTEEGLPNYTHIDRATTERNENPKRRRICLWATGVSLVTGLVFLILGLTVFKVRDPRMTVNYVTLSALDVSLETAALWRVLFNVTLDVGISLRNPNWVSFQYSNTTMFLSYRGTDVSQVPLQANKVGACHTTGLNFSLTLMADRFLSNATMYSDVISGTVPLQNHIRISGKARLLFFTIHAKIYSDCDMQIYVANRSMSAPDCRYKTKL